MEEITQEEIQRHVTATFDSVNLIKRITSSPGVRTQEEIDTVNRNEAHLRIMLAKEWFASALTTEQDEIIRGMI